MFRNNMFGTLCVFLLLHCSTYGCIWCDLDSYDRKIIQAQHQEVYKWYTGRHGDIDVCLNSINGLIEYEKNLYNRIVRKEYFSDKEHEYFAYRALRINKEDDDKKDSGDLLPAQIDLVIDDDDGYKKNTNVFKQCKGEINALVLAYEGGIVDFVVKELEEIAQIIDTKTHNLMLHLRAPGVNNYDEVKNMVSGLDKMSPNISSLESANSINDVLLLMPQLHKLKNDDNEADYMKRIGKLFQVDRSVLCKEKDAIGATSKNIVTAVNNLKRAHIILYLHQFSNSIYNEKTVLAAHQPKKLGKYHITKPILQYEQLINLCYKSNDLGAIKIDVGSLKAFVTNVCVWLGVASENIPQCSLQDEALTFLQDDTSAITLAINNLKDAFKQFIASVDEYTLNIANEIELYFKKNPTEYAFSELWKLCKKIEDYCSEGDLKLDIICEIMQFAKIHKIITNVHKIDVDSDVIVIERDVYCSSINNDHCIFGTIQQCISHYLDAKAKRIADTIKSKTQSKNKILPIKCVTDLKWDINDVQRKCGCNITFGSGKYIADFFQTICGSRFNIDCEINDMTFTNCKNFIGLEKFAYCVQDTCKTISAEYLKNLSNVFEYMNNIVTIIPPDGDYAYLSSDSVKYGIKLMKKIYELNKKASFFKTSCYFVKTFSLPIMEEVYPAVDAAAKVTKDENEKQKFLYRFQLKSEGGAVRYITFADNTKDRNKLQEQINSTPLMLNMYIEKYCTYVASLVKNVKCNNISINNIILDFTKSAVETHKVIETVNGIQFFYPQRLTNIICDLNSCLNRSSANLLPLLLNDEAYPMEDGFIFEKTLNVGVSTVKRSLDIIKEACDELYSENVTNELKRKLTVFCDALLYNPNIETQNIFFKYAADILDGTAENEQIYNKIFNITKENANGGLGMEKINIGVLNESDRNNVKYQIEKTLGKYMYTNYGKTITNLKQTYGKINFNLPSPPAAFSNTIRRFIVDFITYYVKYIKLHKENGNIRNFYALNMMVGAAQKIFPKEIANKCLLDKFGDEVDYDIGINENMYITTEQVNKLFGDEGNADDNFKNIYDKLTEFVSQESIEKLRIFKALYDINLFDAYKGKLQHSQRLGGVTQEGILKYLQNKESFSQEMQKLNIDDDIKKPKDERQINKYMQDGLLVSPLFEDYISYCEARGDAVNRTKLNEVYKKSAEGGKDRRPKFLSANVIDTTTKGFKKTPADPGAKPLALSGATEVNELSLYDRLIAKYDGYNDFVNGYNKGENEYQTAYLSGENIEGLDDDIKTNIKNLMKKGLPEVPEGLQEAIERLHLKMLSGNPRPGQEKLIGTKGTSAEVFLFDDTKNYKAHVPLIIKVIKTKFQKKSEIKMLYEALINLRIKEEQERQEIGAPINRNVIKIYNVFYCDNPISTGDYQGNLVVVMESCPNGDLKNYLIKQGTLPNIQEIGKYYVQIVDTIEALHNIGILHMDIKLANILMSAKNDLKLIDFGYSILFDPKKKDTFCYGNDFTKECDKQLCKIIEAEEQYYIDKDFSTFSDKLGELKIKNNYVDKKKQLYNKLLEKGHRVTKYCMSNSFWVMSYKQFSMFFNQYAIEITSKNIDKELEVIQIAITREFLDNGYVNTDTTTNSDYNLFNILTKEDMKALSSEGMSYYDRATLLQKRHIKEIGRRKGFDISHLYDIYEFLKQQIFETCGCEEEGEEEEINSKKTDKKLSGAEKQFAEGFFDIQNGEVTKHTEIANVLRSLMKDKKMYKNTRDKELENTEMDGVWGGYNVFQSDYCALLTMLLSFIDKSFFDLIAIEDLEKDANRQLQRTKEQIGDSMIERYCYYMFSTLFNVKKDEHNKYQIYLSEKNIISSYLKNKCPKDVAEVIQYLIDNCFKHVENFEQIENSVLKKLKAFALYKNYALSGGIINNDDNDMKKVYNIYYSLNKQEHDQLTEYKKCFVEEDILWKLAELQRLAHVYDYRITDAKLKNAMTQKCETNTKHIDITFKDALFIIDWASECRNNGDNNLYGVFLRNPDKIKKCDQIIKKILDTITEKDKQKQYMDEFCHNLGTNIIEELQHNETQMLRGDKNLHKTFQLGVGNHIDDYIEFVEKEKNAIKQDKYEEVDDNWSGVLNETWHLAYVNGERRFDTVNENVTVELIDGCRKKFRVSNMNSIVIEGITYGMFQDGKSIKTISINLNTSTLTNIANMFKGCVNLERVDIIGASTQSCTDMSGLFQGCAALKTINGLEKFDTSKVTDMSRMFMGCSGLDIVDDDTVLRAKYKVNNFLKKDPFFKDLVKSQDIFLWHDLNSDYYADRKITKTNLKKNSDEDIVNKKNKIELINTWEYTYNDLKDLYPIKIKTYARDWMRFTKQCKEDRESQRLECYRYKEKISETIKQIKEHIAYSKLGIYLFKGPITEPLRFKQFTLVKYIGYIGASGLEYKSDNFNTITLNDRCRYFVVGNSTLPDGQELPFNNLPNPCFTLNDRSKDVQNIIKDTTFNIATVIEEDVNKKIDRKVEEEIKKLTDDYVWGMVFVKNTSLSDNVFKYFREASSSKIKAYISKQTDLEKKFGVYDAKTEEKFNPTVLMKEYSVKDENSDTYGEKYKHLRMLYDILQTYLNNLTTPVIDKLINRIYFIKEALELKKEDGTTYIYNAKTHEELRKLGNNISEFDMLLLTYPCKNNSLGIEGWNTQQVENMDNMFFNCTSLYGIDLNKWDNRSLTSCQFMFGNCVNLQSCSMNKIQNDNNVDIKCAYMFDKCVHLGSAFFWENFKPSLGTINNMFSGCDNLSIIGTSDKNKYIFTKDNFYIFGLWNDGLNKNMKMFDVEQYDYIKNIVNPMWLMYKVTEGKDFKFSKQHDQVGDNQITINAKVLEKELDQNSIDILNNINATQNELIGNIDINDNLGERAATLKDIKYPKSEDCIFYVNDISNIPASDGGTYSMFDGRKRLRTINIVKANNINININEERYKGLLHGCSMLQNGRVIISNNSIALNDGKNVFDNDDNATNYNKVTLFKNFYKKITVKGSKIKVENLGDEAWDPNDTQNN